MYTGTCRFGRGQTPGGMLGYCQKDSEKPHYKSYFYNITAQQMNSARALRQTDGKDHLRGRIELKRKNLLFEVMTFQGSRLRSIQRPQPGIVDVLLVMIAGGTHVLAPQWILPTSNRFLEPAATAALHLMWATPKRTSRSSIMDVLFGPDSYSFKEPVRTPSVPRRVRVSLLITGVPYHTPQWFLRLILTVS